MDRNDPAHSLRLTTSAGSVPLGYVREGDRIHLVARERAAAWPVETLRNGRATLIEEGRPVQGEVDLVRPGEEFARILSLFRAKYGAEAYQRWYDHPARVLTIRLSAGTPAPAGPEGYYRWLEAEFDNVAAAYDGHILGNRMNRLLRERSLARLRPSFEGAHRLLEVGCGSGLETLSLLEAGHEITAVDISPAMLEVVRGKATRAGLSERLTTVVARAGALPVERLVGRDGGFDGGYSTYGAINCEAELAPIREGFFEALRPGGLLLLGIYNRWCLFELLAYGFTLQWSRALGRARNPVRVGSSRFCVDVFAYSTRDIVRGFSPGFVPLSTEAVPFLLPPSDLTGYAEKFSTHFEALSRVDRWVGRRPEWAGWGDHFLMTLRRDS